MTPQITVQDLQRALGGVISRGKNGPQVLCPGPGHSSEDRSLAVYPSMENEDGFIVGLFSLGTALMLTWEWLEEHIFTRFELAHYRPRGREREVFIVHPKNGESVWHPLFDASGAALFPELVARMDRLKANRVGNGLFFLRDWVNRRAGVPLPWASR